MFRYIMARVIQIIVVVWGVSLIVFMLMHLSGDPVSLLLPMETDAHTIEAFRREMGFDRPLLIQYCDFLSRALRGDFGMSLRHGQPAMGMVAARLPATLKLTLMGLLISLAISLPVGVLAAVHRGDLIDAGASVLALLGQSVPSFWLGIMVIMLFSIRLRLLPATGSVDLRGLLLPSVTIGAFSSAMTVRLLRSGLIGVMDQAYIRTARSKGLHERAVLLKHGLRNAALPVLTVVGLQFGTLMSGSVITETVFAYPGMSLLAVQAIQNRDITVVQAFVVVCALVISTASLVTDVLYAVVDPRIRYQ